MKKSIFIILCALTSQVVAQESKIDPTYVFSELLVWRVREGGADNWAQNLTPKSKTQENTIIDAPFNGNAGFRVGVGYNFSHYDTVLSYTQYHTKATNQASGSIYSAFLGNFYATNVNGSTFEPYYDSGNIDWNFSFNVIDIELGKTWIIDKLLTVRPFLGLKTAFIDQTIHSYWQGPHNSSTYAPISTYTHATEVLENNFWGIGPSIGIDTLWPIYHTPQYVFSIFGDFSGAIYWAHWSFKDRYTNNTPVSININSADISGAATMAQAFIGIEFKNYLPKAILGIKLGYETQVWFDQLQFYSLNMGRMNNLMSLQGGVLDFSLNF